MATSFPDDNWLLCLLNDSSSFSNVLHTLEQYNNNIVFNESIGFYSYWCIRILEKKYSLNVSEKALNTWYKYMESKLYDKFIEITAGELEDLTIKLCHDILMIAIFLITKSNYMFTLQLFKFLNIFQMILKDLGYYEYSRICILNHFEIHEIYRILILLDYIMVDASFKLGKPLINEDFLDSIFENEIGKKFLDSYQDFNRIYLYTVVKKVCYLNMFASNVKFENVNQLISLLHRLNNKLDNFDVAMNDVINEKGKLTTFQVLGVDSRTMKILINRLPIQICMASHLKTLLHNDELKANFNSTLEYARTILHMYCREDNLFTFPLMVSSLHLCVSMIQSISRGAALDMFFNDLIKMDSIFVYVIKSNVLQKEFLQRIIFLMFSIIEYNNMLNPNSINNFTDHLQNLMTFQKYESYNFNLDLESIIDRASSFFNPILEYDNFASILVDPNDERW